MNRRVAAAALAAVAAVPLSGCYEKEIREGNFFGVLYHLIAGSTGAKYKAVKVETELEVDLEANVGGLSGTYEIILHNPEGGEFGSFTGTGVVKRGRFVTLKDTGSEGLFSAVEAMVEASSGEDVVIEKAKAKVTAFQTPGGVEAVYKAKITFSGFVSGGENDGAKIRKGKILAGDSFTSAP